MSFLLAVVQRNAPVYFFQLQKDLLSGEKTTIALRKEPEVQLWKKKNSFQSFTGSGVWEGKYCSLRMIQRELFGGVCFEVGIRKAQQLLVPVFWLLIQAQFFPVLSKLVSSQWKL